ncbi:MAG: ABC transporter substrate-binding protein [Deltaproteobacteria bacterium]|nr:ABC transporter substrate-binding protein [Deltaproteobacteria bacterium]
MIGIKGSYRLLFPAVLLLTVIFLLPAKAVHGQSKELIEAAKKEGKVSIFGSLCKKTVKRIQTSFEKKYPGIKTYYWRGSGTAILKKAMSEYYADKVTWDVFLTAKDAMEIMRKEGMFAKYQTPLGQYFEKQYHHPFFSPAYRKIIVGFAYNTKHLKPSEAPKTYADFIDPKWKGKFTMGQPAGHTFTVQWLSSLHVILGSKEKEDEYIRRLAANKPHLVQSMNPTSKVIASGEVPLGITYIKYVYILGEQGAPMDYVRLPGYLGDSQYISTGSKAPHPNAGKLWIDHFYSPESMKIIAKSGEFVTMTGVYPPLKGAEKIKYVQMVGRSKKEYKSLKKKYGKIFRK